MKYTVEKKKYKNNRGGVAVISRRPYLNKRKRYAVVFFNDTIGCMTSGEIFTSNDLLCACAYADTF